MGESFLYKKVSLYIPVYNAAKFLNRVMQAVILQTYPLGEILIIDDCSTDGSMDVVAKYIDGKVSVSIIRHNENKGLACARNTGVSAAKGEFVASLDADVVPDKDWLKNLMVEFNDNCVLGVGGNLIETFKNDIADHWRDTFMRQSWGDERVKNPYFLYGSNNVFRKNVLIDVGLYNEQCRTNGEDISLTKKIKQLKNATLIYTPAAKCYHLRKDTFVSIMKTCWRWGFYGNWNKPSFRRSVIANYNNFRRMTKYWKRDIKKLDFPNIIIDLCFPFYSCYFDWGTYIKSNLSARESK